MDDQVGCTGMQRVRAASVWCLAIVLITSGCSTEQPQVTLHDDLGRAVTAPHKIERVVTLAPNLTEILFAIGVGGKVVATDDFSETPAAAKRLPKVGGLQPNIERIAAARPDLVIATTNGNHPSLAPALAAAGIPLFVVRTDRVDEIAAVMERLGVILGAADAKRAAESLRKEIAANRRTRAKPPRVLFAVWPDPLYIAGRNTFGDDLLLLSGATNAVTVTGWPQLSLETVVANPPDILIYPNRSVTQSQMDALLARAPLLKTRTMTAPVDENTFTRPGPRVPQAIAGLNAVVDRWESSH